MLIVWPFHLTHHRQRTSPQRKVWTHLNRKRPNSGKPSESHAFGPSYDSELHHPSTDLLGNQSYHEDTTKTVLITDHIREGSAFPALFTITFD
ncbi:hypothetical protein QR680_004810 [Steinernema hermaphroditum]|uniref:Uncharacterized protein n=1 Tax=Steinernema hermaphroditum TaxID=289476 RepID=A0AA39HS34_9BILA|nr:hypothetical protein QR680_004810 [Steinernema hermaphroditum]